MADLAKKIKKAMANAIHDYQMIEEGDRIMVACSGGKDSTIMLLILEDMRRRSPVSFEIVPVLLDQKQPNFNVVDFKLWLKDKGFDLTVLEEDTYSIVTEKTPEGKSFCGLCSRLRRGILYNYAEEHGFTNIALGHHREDLNETLLMNLFFAGKMASMPPKLKSRDSRNVVIRPMSYVAEDLLISHAKDLKFPIIPCNLCGSQDNMRRQQIKATLKRLSGTIPNIEATLLNAQKNVKPSLLLDRDLWNFEEIQEVDKEQALAIRR